MMSGGRIEICYNVQTAVDAKHKLIVAEDVTNAAGDRDQLSPMVAAAQEVLPGATPVVVADQGYYHGAEIKRCVEAGVTPLVPRPLTSANEARGLFTKDDFVYDAGVDAYRCPAGERLTYRSTTLELGRTIKNYRTSVCRSCALKPRCTRNKDGRKITRWVDEHLLEDMEARLRRDRALFARRKELAEHPFGTMKRGMDQGYFLLKGLRKIRGEFSLTVLAYNLGAEPGGRPAAAGRPRVGGISPSVLLEEAPVTVSVPGLSAFPRDLLRSTALTRLARSNRAMIDSPTASFHTACALVRRRVGRSRGGIRLREACDLAQSTVHRRGVGEGRCHIGVQHDDVRALRVAACVLPMHTTTEIVLGSHLVRL